MALALAYYGINYMLYPVINITWILIIDILLYCLVNIIINLKTKTSE